MTPKCPICGWIGYQSLLSFECAGFGCQNHSWDMSAKVHLTLKPFIEAARQEWETTHEHKTLRHGFFPHPLFYEIEISVPGFCEAIQVLQYTPATLIITPENYDQRDQLKPVLLKKMEKASRYAANVFTR